MKSDVINFLSSELGLEPEDAQPLYESFMEAFGEVVGELRETRPDDEAGLRRITHNMMGFSQNVGALDLFEAAKVLNACAKAHDVPGAEASSARIIALHDAYAGG